MWGSAPLVLAAASGVRQSQRMKAKHRKNTPLKLLLLLEIPFVRNCSLSEKFLSPFFSHQHLPFLVSLGFDSCLLLLLQNM